MQILTSMWLAGIYSPRVLWDFNTSSVRERTFIPAVWRETNAGIDLQHICPWESICCTIILSVNCFSHFKNAFIINVSYFEPLVPWTFWLVSSFFRLFYSSFPVSRMNWGKKKKKRELKQKALKPWRQGSLCQNVGQLWACRTQYPFPWNHKVLLLDNTNISTDVLYILQNACYLFVSIYLFIWFVVLNAYLCIPIILYASGPYVKAVLLLRLSSNIILCPQPASALVVFFSFFVL